MTDAERRALIVAEDRFADAMRDGRKCYIVKVREAEVSKDRVRAYDVEILFTDKGRDVEIDEFHFSDYYKVNDFLKQMRQSCGLTPDMVCGISKGR